jgi:hypothetical protein
MSERVAWNLVALGSIGKKEFLSRLLDHAPVCVTARWLRT